MIHQCKYRIFKYISINEWQMIDKTRYYADESTYCRNDCQYLRNIDDELPRKCALGLGSNCNTTELHL